MASSSSPSLSPLTKLLTMTDELHRRISSVIDAMTQCNLDPQTDGNRPGFSVEKKEEKDSYALRGISCIGTREGNQYVVFGRGKENVIMTHGTSRWVKSRYTPLNSSNIMRNHVFQLLEAEGVIAVTPTYAAIIIKNLTQFISAVIRIVEQPANLYSCFSVSQRTDYQDTICNSYDQLINSIIELMKDDAIIIPASEKAELVKNLLPLKIAFRPALLTIPAEEAKPIHWREHTNKLSGLSIRLCLHVGHLPFPFSETDNGDMEGSLDEYMKILGISSLTVEELEKAYQLHHKTRRHRNTLPRCLFHGIVLDDDLPIPSKRKSNYQLFKEFVPEGNQDCTQWPVMKKILIEMARDGGIANATVAADILKTYAPTASQSAKTDPVSLSEEVKVSSATPAFFVALAVAPRGEEAKIGTPAPALKPAMTSSSSSSTT